jgi:hypothetical protein
VAWWSAEHVQQCLLPSEWRMQLEELDASSNSFRETGVLTGSNQAGSVCCVPISETSISLGVETYWFSGSCCVIISLTPASLARIAKRFCILMPLPRDQSCRNAPRFFLRGKHRGRERAWLVSRKEIEHDRNVGLGPNHDWSSHAADGFGLMCIHYDQPTGAPPRAKVTETAARAVAAPGKVHKSAFLSAVKQRFSRN